jgi:transcriptional regulator GlxA family with amidase domain
VTFKYWMDFLRVARAVKLLENSDLQIVEIAETCGFEDATTFTRTFRRILNRTPIQCRREGGFAVRSVRPEQTPKDS